MSQTSKASKRLKVESEAELIGGTSGARSFPDSDRERRIAEAAYYRAEQRGFAPGCEVEDWLAAEGEVDGSTADP